MSNYLEATRILDYRRPAVQELIEARGWRTLPEFTRIGSIYDFVRDEIPFGYNASDEIPASKVLGDGYGQCNTKSSLLMALLRGCSIECRLHGFTIDKKLQKGAITGIFYSLSPQQIIHTWVELRYEGRWVGLEGVILDRPYLESIQRRFSSTEGGFCGYAIATDNLARPAVEWQGTDTCIQKEGVVKDFGVFDSPDELYATHGSNLGGLKRFLFMHVVRKIMNRNISRIRGGKW